MERTKQRIEAIDQRIAKQHSKPMFSFQAELASHPDTVIAHLHQKARSPEQSDSLWLLGQPATQLRSETDGQYIRLHYNIGTYEGIADGCMLQDGIILQGHWWYRGDIRIEPLSDHCRVQYRVYNIAPGLSRWAATLMRTTFYRQSKHTFAALLDALSH